MYLKPLGIGHVNCRFIFFVGMNITRLLEVPHMKLI